MDFICELTKNVTGNIWIGGKLEWYVNPFEYEWTDGSKFDYTNWNDGEPNYDGKFLGIEIYADSCKWNDVVWNANNYYICKKSV